jgi:hypothetical protein
LSRKRSVSKSNQILPKINKVDAVWLTALTIFIKTNQEKFMSTSTIQLKKLWWVGPMTVFSAVIGVLIVRSIALAILPPPSAPGLEMIFLPIFLTVVLCTAAVVVYVSVARFA